MTEQELAQEIRIQDGHPPSKEDILSDEVLIDCYVRCSTCGKRAIPLDDLGLIIAKVKDVGDFMDRLKVIDETEPDKAHRGGCRERQD